VLHETLLKMNASGGTANAPDSRSPRSGSEERPKVIYVMGAGRSGSTILGVTLGNCDGIFYAGELDKWLSSAGVPPLKDPERVSFWRGIREELGDAAELFGGEARQLERSSDLFRPSAWRARRRLRGRYRRVAEQLYHAVARAAGATHVVDTSHYPLRARELQALDGIELYLLFLVRDPRSVVASFSRDDVPEPRAGMPTTNAYLALTYVLSTLVFLRQRRDRRLLVRHEDFVADPQRVAREILDWVDLPASIPDPTALSTGLPFHGNRMIRSELVSIDGRAADKASRSRIRSRVTTLIQLPMTVMLSRLRPAASGTEVCEHVD
jgi:hypothetical protein